MTDKDYIRIGAISALNNVESRVLHNLCETLAIDNPTFIKDKDQSIEYMYSRAWSEMTIADEEKYNYL